MKHLFFIGVFLCFIYSVTAQQLSFSDSSVVSLVTCSPGEEVYAKFGHTGIRVSDPVSNIDVVFNYGIFSFDTNGFYYKFIKGETDYYLGLSSTSVFLSEYQRRNSMVWEQVLNLNTNEKRTLINSLLENYKPENRMYRYNFVFDNCATRPRDKILNSVDGFVRFGTDEDPKTFRQWVGNYVGEESWLKFGIDMVFGIDADRECSQFESMFLPEVLMVEMQSVYIDSPRLKSKRPLIGNKNVLVDAQSVVRVKESWTKEPLFVFCIIFLIGVAGLIFEFKTKHYKPVIDSVLLFLTGSAGLILFYLMFISVHPLVKNNLNLLWANPLNFFMAFLIWVKPLRKTIFYYQIFNLFLLGLALVALALSIQSFNVAVYPVIALLIIRYARWIVRTKHKFERKSKYQKSKRN